MSLYLGLDFGTTGARACVLDNNRNIVHADSASYPDPERQTPQEWREALLALLNNQPAAISTRLQGMAIAATSATVLFCKDTLEPASPALLYSDARAQKEAAMLQEIAPPGHTVCSATSGLAKFLWLGRNTEWAEAACFMHQADWLAALLTGKGGIADYHNALKTGYDAEQMRRPEWVLQLPHAHLLPQVVAPGAPLSPLHPSIAAHFRINPECIVHAGTTDSIAAFIASGASRPGEAVTSLGTTIVLKLLSERRVEEAKFGIYSHRYGDLWLVGGASNAGGGVLRQHFSDMQLAELSRRIDPEHDSPLDYYPLPCPGERFPVNDPALMPRLEPRPADDAEFLHGLLQGLVNIEVAGYARLAELGATPPTSVITCGGGAKNPVWSRMRERMLGVQVTTAAHTETAYGSALLAMRNACAGKAGIALHT